MTKQKFDDEVVLEAIPYMSWEKVGDKATGVYVGKVLNNNPDDWGKIKEEYVLETGEGTYIKIGGRALPKGCVDGEDYRVIFGMENVAYGEVLGFKYTEDRPTKKGNPVKIIQVIYPGVRSKEPEAVEKYTALYGENPAVGKATAPEQAELVEEEIPTFDD